jgi:hypothetical protein
MKSNIKAYKDGRLTGLKFDGSENWDYTPGGPFRLGHRRHDTPEMTKKVEQNELENAAWFEGFNETCHPSLRKEP